MKKILMLLALIGMVFTASAQMCKVTGGVEASTTTGSTCDVLSVTLENTNDYKVTVNLTVTVVDKEGNSVERKKTVVIPAQKKDKKVSFRTKKIKGETKCVDVPECTVDLYVEKCE